MTVDVWRDLIQHPSIFGHWQIQCGLGKELFLERQPVPAGDMVQGRSSRTWLQTRFRIIMKVGVPKRRVYPTQGVFLMKIRMIFGITERVLHLTVQVFTWSRFLLDLNPTATPMFWTTPHMALLAGEIPNFSCLNLLKSSVHPPVHSLNPKLF